MSNYARTCWFILLAGVIASVWAAPEFITQDGSSHLHTITSVFGILSGAEAPSSVLEFNDWKVPAWGGSLALGACVALLGPASGEKLFVSLILIIMATGFRALLRSAGLRSDWPAFLIMPFLLSHILSIGLYFFLLASGCSLWLLAIFVRNYLEVTYNRLALLAIGLFLICAVHPLPAALTGLGLITYTGVLWIHARGRSPESRQAFMCFLQIAVAGIPSATLFLLTLLEVPQTGPISLGRNLGEVALELLALAILVPFSRLSPWWITLLGATYFFACGLWMIRRTRTQPRGFPDKKSMSLTPWLCAIAALIVMMWICPEGVSASSLISYRLGLLVWIGTAGVLAVGLTRPSLARLAPLVVGISTIATVMQSLTFFEINRRVSPLIHAVYAAHDVIPDGEMVWPIALNPTGLQVDQRTLSPRNPLLSHLPLRPSERIRNKAMMVSYQGEVPHFALRFRQPAPSSFFADGMEYEPYEFVLPNEANGFVILVGLLPDVNFQETKLGRSIANRSEIVFQEGTAFGSVLTLRLHEASKSNPAATFPALDHLKPYF